MPPVNIMIKPASSACNMRCAYCFYRDVSAHREHAFEGMLSLETMEKIIRAAAEYAEGSCTILFQGGEPTLAGLDFYRQTLELEQKYQKPGLRFDHSIQTNGLALDAQWAQFFRDNRFLVGLSLDGPAPLHDANRLDTAGKGTFNRVMRAVDLLRKYGVAYNVLCVVTGQNARSVQSVYQFCKKQDFRWLQFIPCLEPLDAPRGEARYHLSPEAYGRFLVTLFDLWYQDLKKGRYVSVRHLDNWLGVLLGREPEACSMRGQCAVQFVIEADGGVYPCDFYVLDQWRLGTVGEQTFAQMRESERARQFLQASRPAPEQCAECGNYPLCRNGCRRDRVEAPDGQPARNYYCQAYKQFFAQRGGQLQQAARLLAQWQR